MSKTYKTENHYFDTPAQVRWRMDAETMKENGAKWFYGIAYCGELICGCCGGVTEAEEAEEIQVLPWINIEAEIRGTDCDEDLDPDDDWDLK